MARSENEVTHRLDELAEFKRGWLDGEGEVISPAVIKFLRKYSDQIVNAPASIYIYPTEKGGIQLEWRGDWLSYGMEIYPNMSADFWAMDMSSKYVPEDDHIITISGNWFKERIKQAR